MDPLPVLVWLWTFVTLPLQGYEPLYVPSGSMKPSLLVGDHFLVPRASIYDPVQGDVVVFPHPSNGTLYVKRIVGLQLDTVQLRGGVLYLNGQAVPLSPYGVFSETFEAQGTSGSMPRCITRASVGTACEKEQLIETLPNGRSYPILNIGSQALDDTVVYTVPDGHVFVLGDNRDNSIDSRVSVRSGGIGFVPVSSIRGRVSRIVYSASYRHRHAFWTWRPERFFKGVQ